MLLCYRWSGNANAHMTTWGMYPSLVAQIPCESLSMNGAGGYAAVYCRGPIGCGIHRAHTLPRGTDGWQLSCVYLYFLNKRWKRRACQFTAGGICVCICVSVYSISPYLLLWPLNIISLRSQIHSEHLTVPPALTSLL